MSIFRDLDTERVTARLQKRENFRNIPPCIY